MAAGDHSIMNYLLSPIMDPYFVLAALLIILIVGSYFMMLPYLQSKKDPHALSYRHSYIDFHSDGSGEEKDSTGQGTAHPFPSLYDPPSKYLSLIVPAYNEENRLQEMMQETMSYLLKRKREEGEGFTFEIVLVNDGSKDRTSEVALEYVKIYKADNVRLLELAVNQGKGGAVQQGMLHARGKYLLMLDADGATDIRDLQKVEQGILSIEKDGLGISVGSRAHLQDEAVAQRKWYRNILMYGFHFMVQTVGGVSHVRDTQCGFKLFTRKTAQILFASQHLRRWCFDVELLHMAEKLGIPMKEVGVRWQEIAGSKINLLESSFVMGRDLVVIRFCHLFGLWKITLTDEARRIRAAFDVNSDSANNSESERQPKDIDMDALRKQKRTGSRTRRRKRAD